MALLHAAVAEPRSRVRALILLRADFTDRPLQYPEFGELMRQHTEFVLPLSAEELSHAVTGPARRVGVAVEGDLLAALVGDVNEQPGALPMLQYALTETFEHAGGGRLTLDAYHAIGGLSGALARRADEVFSRLDAPAQAQARQLFLRLVTLGEGTEDTRRRVLRAELEALTPLSGVSGVLDAFGKARLLSFDRDPGTRAPTVEVAHEALLREWPRLRGWLSDSRADIRTQRALAQAAGEWQAASRDPSYLLTGSRLAQFEAWMAVRTVALTPAERAFLDASVAQRQALEAAETERQRRELEAAKKLAETERRSATGLRRRNRVITTVGLVALLAAIVAGFFGYSSSQNLGMANRNAATAQAANTQSAQNLSDAQAANTQVAVNLTHAVSLRLAAEASRLLVEPDGNVETAALLSIRALQRGYLPQADETLQTSAHRLYALRTFIGHTDAVVSVAFSPDGKYVLTGGFDHTAKLWDAATGELVRDFYGHTGAVDSVAFSPDGKYVLTGSGDATARLWDAATGELVRDFYGYTEESVQSVAFSPDEKYVLMGSWDGPGQLLDLVTGAEVRTFTRPGTSIMGVAFSADGKYILTGSYDGTANLWDAATGAEVRAFAGHSDHILSVAFSPDGKYVLTGDSDNTAKLWDAATGTEVRTFAGHTSNVNTVAFSPDGKYVLTGSGDGTAKLWGADTGTEVRNFLGQNAAFSPDGKYVLTGSYDDTATLWDASVTPEGNGAPGMRTFRPQAGNVYSAAFSPDGQYVLTGSDKGSLEGALWSGSSGQPIRSFVGHALAVLSVAFSPDGKYVLTGSNDGTAKLWEAATGTLVRTFIGHMGGVLSVVFSPDGKYVLTGSNDNTAKLWDAATGAEVRTFTSAYPVFIVALSPDGRYVLATADKTAQLWSAATGAPVRAFVGHAALLYSVAFSPDGKYVLTGSNDKTAKLWDAATGALVRTFAGHAGAVQSVAFSPDGKTVLTGSNDRTAILWDAATGVEVRAYAGHTGPVYSVAFSPDGKSVLTGSLDGTARVWDVDYRPLLSWVCARLTRDLTPVERNQYGITDTAPTCPAK
jgi:WD40 repeat protein